MHRIVLGLLTLWLWTHTASGADSATDCVRIEDDRARLDCYDEALGRVQSPASVIPATKTAAVPAAAPAPAAVPAAAATPPVGPAPTSFGFAPKQAEEDVRATVVSVTSSPQPGRWVATLDNGQVWEQSETTSAAKRLRPGDTVTIRSASLGSYILAAPDRGSSRVRRVR